MIKVDDILQYTTPIGGETKYYIDEVYEATEEWMVIFSWKEDGLWMRDVRPLQEIEKILLSGHIRLVGRCDAKPNTYIRPHHFNPQLRDLPHSFIQRKLRKGIQVSPYYTPKLYQWN